MIVSLVAAVDRHGLIGAGGQLPWHLPADLRHFKATTMGHHIIMGRKTWVSIGRPLPGRVNVVVTREPLRLAEAACTAVDSLEAALEVAFDAGDDEVFVIGGAQLYALALPHAQRIHLTRIDAAFEGDVYFPELDSTAWTEVSRIECEPDPRNQFRYAFCVLERA
jgi:dihydrofolate reductase